MVAADNVIDKAKKKWEEERLRKRKRGPASNNDYQDPIEFTTDDHNYDFEGNVIRFYIVKGPDLLEAKKLQY